MVAGIILVVLGAEVVEAELQEAEEMAIKMDIMELVTAATVVAGMVTAEELVVVAALI
jgi:hypothetical protein